MAKNDDATSSRRRLLKIAATAAAAAPMGGAALPAPSADPDAELVALCAAWRRAFDREKAVTERLFRMHQRHWSAADRDLLDAVEADVHELERRVFGARAVTLAGAKAKAGVLAHLDAAAGIPAEPEQAASLVADIVALLETAA